MILRLDFTGNLKKSQRLPSGALRVPAYLTKTGVFEYQRADGSVSKELRTPEEVFAQTALDSFKGVAVTVGHPGKVTSENWKTHSVGHVGDDIRVDGDFVAASLVIHDLDTIHKIEDGKLVEISCGYECEIHEDNAADHTHVQKNIVGNHVALGPRQWGRAGPEVRMYLDSNDSSIVDDPYTAGCMELKEALAEIERLKAVIDTTQAKSDSLEAENTAIKTQLSDLPKGVDAAVNLRLAARQLVGDSLDFAGKTDREIRIAAILASDPEFKADGRSDAYLEARFDLVCDSAKDAKQKLASLQAPVSSAVVEDGGVDKAEEAKLNQKKRLAVQWKGES